MWHASISPLVSLGRRLDAARLFELALATLRGVGTVSLGEWREVGTVACHVRRRLSAEEMIIVGPVRDLRGTPEALTRLWRARQWMPAPLWPMAEEEIHGSLT